MGVIVAKQKKKVNLLQVLMAKIKPEKCKYRLILPVGIIFRGLLFFERLLHNLSFHWLNLIT